MKATPLISAMYRPTHLIRILLITSFTALSLHAQRAADPDPTRYAEAMEAFAEADAKNPVQKGGIVFVGSSSIRRLDIPTVHRFRMLTTTSKKPF